MTAGQPTETPSLNTEALDRHLSDLKLPFIAEHYHELVAQAAHKEWAHLDYLGHLIEGEALARRARATKNRIRQARFP